MAAENNRISGNGSVGVFANARATIRLSNTFVTNNVGAGVNNSGSINIFGNNKFAGNAVNVCALSGIGPQ